MNGFAWAYNDQAIFVSIGGLLKIGKLFFDIPSLRLLASRTVWSSLVDETEATVDELPLPAQEKSMIRQHSTHILRVSGPEFIDIAKSFIDFCLCVF